MAATPLVLEIPLDLYEAMLRHAREEAPNECCGLLAGTGLRGAAHFPLKNELASPREYLGDARDMIAAFRRMTELGLELVAIYHSHPQGPPVPSRTDLERNQYGDVPQIIISLAESPPLAKAYRLGPEGFQELGWTFSPRTEVRGAKR